MTQRSPNKLEEVLSTINKLNVSPSNSISQDRIFKFAQTMAILINKRFPYLIEENYDVSSYVKNLIMLKSKDFDRIYDYIAEIENWDRRFSEVFATYRIYGERGVCLIKDKIPQMRTPIDSDKYLNYYYMHVIGHELLESLQQNNYIEDIIPSPLSFVIDEIRNYIIVNSLSSKFPALSNVPPTFIHNSIYNIVIDLVKIIDEKEVISILITPYKYKEFLKKLKSIIKDKRYYNFCHALRDEDYITAHLLLLEYLLFN